MSERDEQLGPDDRAVTVSDTLAAGSLIVIVLLLGAGLGAGILLSDSGDDGPPSANFSFQYLDQGNALIVRHDQGDPIQAGNLVLSKGQTSKTWATVANTNNTTMVEAGAATPLSEQSPFGEPISNDDTVRVVWTDGNQSRELSVWNDQSITPGG